MQIASINVFLLKLTCFLSVLGIALPVGSEPLNVVNLAVLESVSLEDDIRSVSATERQAQFTPVKDVYIGGYASTARWLRFTLQVSEPGAWWLEVQPAILDDVRLYVPKAGGFTEHQAGDRLPFSLREVAYRAFVFNLNVDVAEPTTYYIRLASTSSIMAQLRLWKPRDFYNSKYSEYAIASFIAGVLFLVFLINIGLWYFLKLNVMGWFSLHVLGNLVLMVFSSGFVSQFIFPDNPQLANTLSQFTLPLLLSASAPLLHSVISSKIKSSWLNWIFLAILVLPLIFSLSVFMDMYVSAVRLMLIMALPFYALLLALTANIWIKTGISEIYLWPGVFLTIAGAAVSSLIMLGWLNLGLIPAGFFRPTSFGIILSMQIGILIQVRTINREKALATSRAIRAEIDFDNERKALTEQGRFIGMITHELKTPLAVIDAATQTLERMTGQDNPGTHWRHERIRRAVRRIERLVDQFLRADQIDHVNGRLNPTIFNAVRMLQGVVDASLCPPQRIDLKVPEALLLFADPAHLQIALSNLLDNAIKYSPPDSPIGLQLMTNPRDGVGGVEFVVSNKGAGIAPELQEKVFARYSRGDDVGHISGAGLGLYLVRRIALSHQGSVHLHSQANGVAFHLWLPNPQRPT